MSTVRFVPFVRSRPWPSALDRVSTFARALLFLAALAATSSAQTFTILVNFDGANGSYDGLQSSMSLVQGTDGNFYGTTTLGGANGAGTVLKVSPTGTVTILHSFCTVNGCSDGDEPLAGLVRGIDGNFYGTTFAGGQYIGGTVFRITPSGTLTTLHSFCAQAKCPDGALPWAGLVQATNGNFYGITHGGFINNVFVNGTVFKITPSGVLTTLYTFCAQTNCSDGKASIGGLIQATDGNLYGTTSEAGVFGNGTIFKITPSGSLTTLHSFDVTDGAAPFGPLTQASNGEFYGITGGGGTNNSGTFFKITAAGALSTLYNFCAQPNCADGVEPFSGPVQATNGTFYGTSLYGGVNGDGTIFAVTTGGTLTTLHSFDGNDGTTPYGGLLQATDGAFYGTTQSGGANNDGTIFRLSAGLGPFIETLPTSGKIGAKVLILGTNLAGTASVTFNGTAATFRVVSSSEITATVPTGATTGRVKVTTPTRTLTSNLVFRVSP